MLHHEIEFRPSSTCSIDSFDGSIEAVGGGSGSGNNTGGDANGTGDAAGGYATTAADVAALGMVGAAGAVGGAPGALAGVFALGVFGLNPQQAAINLSHDMSLGLGQAVTANPSFSMFVTSSQAAPAGTFGNDGVPNIYTFAGPQ
jgi:hypothetical protein